MLNVVKGNEGKMNTYDQMMDIIGWRNSLGQSEPLGGERPCLGVPLLRPLLDDARE